MNKPILRIVALLALAALLTGCTASVSNIKMASTHNVDLTKKYTLVQSDVSASSSQLWFLVFLGYEDMNYYKTLGELLMEHDGDILTDVEITTSSYYFVIGTYTEYRVKGNVWKCVEEPVLGLLDPDQLYERQVVDGEDVLVSPGGDTRKVELDITRS